jgi:hypothetical protein
MRASIWLRILTGIILLAALVFLGALVYNAGVAQGLASSSLAAPNGQAAPQPYTYAPFYRPWGFGLFWPIFPLLFLVLIFLAVRGLFFAGWRRRSWGGGYGPTGWRREGVPPMVEEWHRKMHEQQTEGDSSQE